MVDLAASDLIKSLTRAVDEDKAEKAVDAWREALRQSYLREIYDRAAEMPGFGWYRQPELAAGIGDRIALHAAATLLVMDTFNRASGYLPKALEFYFPQSEKKPLTITAVSYTHLDVYKRQLSYPPIYSHISAMTLGKSLCSMM